MKKIPGVLIAAPASGSGKTVISCALMEALQEKGLSVAAGKCGPDYIDPMFHREVLGVDSENLDLFFLNEEQLKNQFSRHVKDADVAVVEGVMGYYDGMGLQTEKASAYDVARTLDLPVLLVVSGRGAALSVVAQILGVLTFRKDHHIRGILLNRTSEMLYPRMKAMIEEELRKLGYKIPVLGYVPEQEVFSLESRHLGLCTPQEIAGLKEQLKKAGRVLEKTFDLDELLALAGYEPDGSSPVGTSENSGDITAASGQLSDDSGRGLRGRELNPVVIGVARDAAFQFYYKDNLELLKEMGCELRFFSPLSDAKLPEGIQGLILGGGYPELYAEQLSRNVSLREQIAREVKSGLPCLAECGGFLYLQEELEDQNGVSWPMAGVISGKGVRTDHLVRFGYVNLIGQEDGVYLKQGETIRGHEFHYWDSTQNGASVKAVKPDGKRSWNCIHMEGNLFAGFPHLCYRSNPEFLRRFVETAKRRASGDSPPRGCQRGQSPKEQNRPKGTGLCSEERKNDQTCPPRGKISQGGLSPLADPASMEAARERWMRVAKPLFSLGKLEDAVIRIAGMKRTADYTLGKKGLVIMCADNGVVAEGVTQTSQEVTAIVADNFTKGEASTSIMAKVAGVDLFPVDIGMVTDVPSVTVPEKKVAYGTKNMVQEAAMTREQAQRAIAVGMEMARELKEKGYGILLTGEMGIGNTTTSSAVAAVLLQRPVEEVTGRGAGLSSEGLERKIAAIQKAIAKNQPDAADPLDVLSKVGGLDIAGLCGVFLGGARERIPVVIDGFISAVAALLAVRMAPETADYLLPSHMSREPAGKMLLDELGLSPFLDCDMNLGEGSGGVAVIPLLEMGLKVYREMSTFEQINVDQYEVLK